MKTEALGRLRSRKTQRFDSSSTTDQRRGCAKPCQQCKCPSFPRFGRPPASWKSKAELPTVRAAGIYPAGKAEDVAATLGTMPREGAQPSRDEAHLTRQRVRDFFHVNDARLPKGPL